MEVLIRRRRHYIQVAAWTKLSASLALQAFFEFKRLWYEDDLSWGAHASKMVVSTLVTKAPKDALRCGGLRS